MDIERGNQMTYEEAKAYKQKLDEKYDADSDKLKAFEKQGKSSMGLMPDHIRALPEWRNAKKACDNSFAELRDFNGWFFKTFKKEYATDRKNLRRNKNENSN